MRIVLDTNVVVRAHPNSNGPARDLLERILFGPHRLVLSQALLDELDDVVRRPRLRDLWRPPSGAVERLKTALARHGEIVSPARGPNIVTDDPDDDVVVYTAIAGHADVICTRDSDLFTAEVTQFCQRNGVRVVSDEALLEELRRSETS